jgi:predicted RNA-binding protein with PUA domain
MLIPNGAEVLCSEKMFDEYLEETYVNEKGKEVHYNRGDVFERLITEKAGQVWTKDNVPFTMAGDIEWNGVAYQIKFEKATFTNEKSLMNLMNK